MVPRDIGEVESWDISSQSSSNTSRQEATPTLQIPEQRIEFCLVCNMATMGPPDSLFIQPCRCGYWVHDKCLISVALQFESMNPGARSIGCKICRRAYNISPVKSGIAKIFSRFTTFWYQNFCNLALETFLVLIADVTFIKVGSLVFRKIYGSEEAERLIMSMTPLRAVLTCQMIPVALIAINNIPWEQGVLHLLRKCSGFPVVGGVFPMEDPELPDVYKDSSDFVLNVMGGGLLPFFALATGMLFATFVEDPYNQFLLGGTTFIFLKGVCKMYYKQKKYSRYCTLRILNFRLDD